MAIVLDGTAGITTPDLTDTSLTSGRVVYAGASGNLTGSSALTFDGTTPTSSNATGAPNFIFNSNANTPYIRFDQSSASKFTIGESSIVGGGGAGFYDFYAVASVGQRFFTGAAERLRITSAGDVGIGTSSPAQKLHVLSASATATVAKFAATNYGNLGTTYIEIGTQFGDGGSRIGNINPSTNNGTLVFETMTASSGVYAERARITSAGDLLIATTSSPSSSGVGSGFVIDTDGRALLMMRTNTTAGRSLCDFGNPNGSVGSISVTGSATAYNTSSDYRLKNTIAPMTGALAKVALLKPVTYKWNADGSDCEGFIAHELAEVCPSAVTGAKDALDANGNIKPQGIDVSFLVATLTAAIQEQQALITTLTERITALEGA